MNIHDLKEDGYSMDSFIIALENAMHSTDDCHTEEAKLLFNYLRSLRDECEYHKKD